MQPAMRQAERSQAGLVGKPGVRREWRAVAVAAGIVRLGVAMASMPCALKRAKLG